MKTYTNEEVRSASLDYFMGDELAADVFMSKYALRDQEGRLYELTPADMHKRLAREFARVEASYSNPTPEDVILSALSGWSIVPQGGPMSAIGNPFQVQSLSNCFVIESPYDSYAGIMKTDQEQVQIMKRRGGVGFDISTIRPKGLRTANAARTTDGIGVFMERFSNSCREVAQGGRRGALMLSISVHHPEVMTFINIKRDKTKVTGANVSVRLSDEFMNAVTSDGDLHLRFPVEHGVKHVVSQNVKARDVWNAIVGSAWESGEPGLLMWDTIIRESPADCYEGFKTTSTNPCSELPLAPRDACRLLLVNVSKFVKDSYLSSAKLDEESFSAACRLAQRLMDDMVDLELEAVDKILAKIKADPEPDDVKRIERELWESLRYTCYRGRRTGLGLTGLGDALASLGIKYGSQESIELVERIYRLLCKSAYASSIEMAKERGAFPGCNPALEVDHPFLSRVNDTLPKEVRDDHAHYGRRNIALLTTAPAGSVSIMTQTTSGCEPVYMLLYKRRKKVNKDDSRVHVDFVDQSGDSWQEYEVAHPGLKRWAQATGLPQSSPELSPYWGATSNEIDWVMAVKMQAAAQRWVDHAISKTVNLPESATIEDVAKVYMEAWRTGCKGITVYRDKSRSGVLVAATENVVKPVEPTVNHAPKRPRELHCDIHRATVQGDSYLVIVSLLDSRPYEVFAGLQEHVEVPRKSKQGILIKNGKNKEGIATYNLRIPIGDDDEMVFKDIVNLFDNPNHGALTRMLSLALRHGAPIQYMVEQLRKDKYSEMQSFSNVIARVMKNYIKDGTNASSGEKKCPTCDGTQLVYQSGCVSCATCAWSKC